MSDIVFLDPQHPNLDTKMISRSSDILILGSAGGHFELWRPSCINKYSLVYEM